MSLPKRTLPKMRMSPRSSTSRRAVMMPLMRGMVGRDAVAHEPVRRGQVIEQVDRDVERPLVLEQDVGGVDAGGSGSDDGQAELGQWFTCQLERSTIASANFVSAFFTGPSGSGASASTASSAQRCASARVSRVTAWLAQLGDRRGEVGVVAARRRTRSSHHVRCGRSRSAASGVGLRQRGAGRAAAGSARRRAGRCPASCRSCSISPARSMTSSISWNATPMRSPNSSTGSPVLLGAFAEDHADRAAAAMSDPVLSASTCR